MRSREPCGCVHDGHRWLSMCEPCKTEHDARHELAHAEHLARQPDGTYFYAVPGLHHEPPPVETVNHVTPPASTGR